MQAGVGAQLEAPLAADLAEPGRCLHIYTPTPPTFIPPRRILARPHPKTHTLKIQKHAGLLSNALQQGPALFAPGTKKLGGPEGRTGVFSPH